MHFCSCACLYWLWVLGSDKGRGYGAWRSSGGWWLRSSTPMRLKLGKPAGVCVAVVISSVAKLLESSAEQVTEPWSPTASWVRRLLLFLLLLLSEGLSFAGLSVVRPKWNLHEAPPKAGITGPYPALPFLVGEHLLTDQCPPGAGMILRRWACLPDLRVHDFPSTVKFLKNPRLVLFVGSCLFIDLCRRTETRVSSSAILVMKPNLKTNFDLLSW